MDLQQFRKKLKEYRGRIGISQEALADGVHKNRSQLSEILNGKPSLSVELVHNIILYLAEEQAIRGQSQVFELLALADVEDFGEAEWKAPPLVDLVPAPPEPLAPSGSKKEGSPLQPLVEEQEQGTLAAPITLSEIEQLLPPEEDFKLYSGRRIFRKDGKYQSRTTYVTVNGRPLKYFGYDKRNPEKERVFEWGYFGAGPSRLSEAILADYLGETYPENGWAYSYNLNALLFATLFKEDFISKLPRDDNNRMDDDWQITSNQIRQWFYSLEEKGITRTVLLREIYGENVHFE